jgi:hypothetical protein
MQRIILFVSLLFFVSCSATQKAQGVPEKPLINATRIMFLIMPIKGFNITLRPFFTACDSVFNKNDIATELLTFTPNGFNVTSEKYYIQSMKKFKPDCIIVLVPRDYGGFLKSKHVKYDIYIMPIDIALLLLSGNSNNQLPNPILLGSFNLKTANTTEKTKQESLEAATEFIGKLRKCITTIQ